MKDDITGSAGSAPVTLASTTPAAKFGMNLVEACSNIQGQLEQLLEEVGTENDLARNRVRSIKNALAEISPPDPGEPK